MLYGFCQVSIRTFPFVIKLVLSSKTKKRFYAWVLKVPLVDWSVGSWLNRAPF